MMMMKAKKKEKMKKKKKKKKTQAQEKEEKIQMTIERHHRTHEAAKTLTSKSAGRPCTTDAVVERLSTWGVRRHRGDVAWIFALEIQVTESVLSGCRWQFLKQKWSANKSSLVGIEILASKSTDANQGRAPRETIGETFFQNGCGFWPWRWRGFGVDILGQGKKGRRISGRLWDTIRDKTRAAFR